MITSIVRWSGAALVLPVMAWGWDGSGSHVPATPELLRLHARYAAALRSVVIHEQVQVKLATGGAGEDHYRQVVLAGVDEGQRQALERAKQEHASEEEVKAIRRHFAQRRQHVEDQVVLRRLANDYRVERLRVVDFAGRRAAYVDRDLRDLSRLLREEGIVDPLALANVSRTRTMLLESNGVTHLLPVAGRLAYRSRHPRYDGAYELRRLGIVPVDLLTSTDTVRVEAVQQPGRLAMTAESRGMHLVAVLRQDVGWRIERFEIRRPSGEPIERLELGDYRQVGDLFLPYSVRRTIAAYGNPQYRVESSRVERVEVNVGQDDLAGYFTIPKGYRIQEGRKVTSR